MTFEELKDVWQRYMHRTDIDADLDHVFLLASTRVAQRVLTSVDVPTILGDETGARMLQHAGLIYLHELAQDDDGQQREMRHFEDAVLDYSVWKSRTDRPTINPFIYAGESNGS